MKRGVLLILLCVLSVTTVVWAGSALLRGEVTASASTQPAVIPQAATAPSTYRGDGRAVIIELKGEINEYNRDRLFHRFDEARRLGANTVILDIDSWGGLVTSGLEISRYIKRQSDLHTVAFIQDKAISAGAMIAMACDEIVVSSSCSLGDCAPIIFGKEGLENMDTANRAKAESPVLLDFDESAARNHHDPLLAAAMVDVTRVVYWIQNPAGERKFVGPEDYKDLTAKGWINVPGEKSPIDGDLTLLVVDSNQAIRYGLATQMLSSADALVAQRGYTLLADLTPGLGERAVEFLSGPIVRSLIISLFFLCIFVIPHAPGHGVAEAVGLGALFLMLGVPMLTGFAQWWELLVIFLGLGLIAFEILLPGHIFPGLTGAAMVLFGLVLTFVPMQFGTPGFQFAWSPVQTGLLSVAAALVISVSLWFWISRFLPRVPYFNRLILTATNDGQAPVADGAAMRGIDTTTGKASWPPVGSIGIVTGDLKPGGAAEFFDAALGDRRIASVISETGFITSGAEVVVREVNGSRIVVRRRL